MLHFGLVEQLQDQLLARRLVADDQRLVLDVRTQAARVHLHRRLHRRRQQPTKTMNKTKLETQSNTVESSQNPVKLGKTQSNTVESSKNPVQLGKTQ